MIENHYARMFKNRNGDEIINDRDNAVEEFQEVIKNGSK